MDVENNSIPQVKLKRTDEKNNSNDVYCFECHYEGDVINCDTCPRVYHFKCLSLTRLPARNWTCPECEFTQSSFNIINQRYSINELHIMLKYVLHRLQSHPQIESFLKSIDLNQNPDDIIHPMNFEIIEENLQLTNYSSVEAFLGDIKWILHNNIIYNRSKLSSIIDTNKSIQSARILLEKARHELTEIEICPECYLRSAQPMTNDWFTESCSIPHTLCWAKMKSYQSWPAKVLRVVNDEVDVRFFGQHDRAWVAYSSCFVLSKEYPGGEKKKSNINFDKSLVELQNHIDQLKKLYGHFTYAPPQTFLSKTKPFKFVSIIDDSILPSYITAGNTNHSKQHHLKIIEKRSNEDASKQSTKRLRVSSSPTNDELQSTLNVFDIFNQSDQILLDDYEIQSRFRSISPTDNKYRIQGLLRRYTHCEIHSDVRSTMTALLDSIEALQTVPEVHTNVPNQIPQVRRKNPRKSNSQHRIIPQNNHSNFVTRLSLDQFLSPVLPFVPLRPLSVSPPSAEIFQVTPTDIDDEIIPQITVKSEEEEEESQPATESSISINSFLIPSSIDATTPLPTLIPSISPIPQQNIWPSVLSIDPPRKQPKKTKTKRLRSSLFDLPSETSIPNSTQTSQIPSDDHQIREEIQMTINNFTDQFQQLLVNLTNEIDSSLRTTRMKYEQDLEEIRRSYRISLNDLHSITTEQVQEIHNSLELQYWKRLSEMRNRYESKFHYSLPLN